MSLITALNWRYAVKKMNGEIVPQEKVNLILEAARLAPTSSGLQPFHVILVSNTALKAQIAPLAYNQPQITACSHLLIFAAWHNYTKERIDTVFKTMNAERGIPDATTEDYKNSLINNLTAKTADENFNHAAKQAYIGLGMALAQAALLEVDSTPMEGFDAPKIDSLLNLQEKGLKSVAFLALGYRDTDGDWLTKLKKVRQANATFITELK